MQGYWQRLGNRNSNYITLLGRFHVHRAILSVKGLKNTIQNDLCVAGKDESDKRGSEEELNNKTKTKENRENMTISGGLKTLAAILQVPDTSPPFLFLSKNCFRFFMFHFS